MRKTPISYYGGKQNMVRHILPLIPPHIQYIESFTGGGAVFFAKHPSRAEVINDLDDRLSNFYRVMKTKFNELHTMIVGTIHSEYNYTKAKDILINGGSDVDRAWALWVQTNMSFSSKIMRGFAFDNIGKSPRSSNNKRNYFYRYEDRLSKVEIFNRDALDVIKLKDGEDSFFYIDPPYVSSDCGHYSGYSMDNFIELLDLLSIIKGKFLLSSYPEIPLMEYSIKNKWNNKDISGIVSASRQKESQKTKTECLTYNYELQPTLF